MRKLLRIFSASIAAALICSAPVHAACLQPLQPCPDSPNCIATNDPNPDRRAPQITLAPEASDTWAQVLAAVLKFERVEIVQETPGYLHATVTSSLMAYVDDLIVMTCDGGTTLGVRSSSREGYWDMGVNARRVATLIERLRESAAIQ